LPSNEGRGYVLRRIMRRALYHRQRMGLNEPFLYKLSGAVIHMMKNAYPELTETAPHVSKAIRTEEEKYSHTTKIGLERLRQSPVLFHWHGPKADQPLGVYEVPFGELEAAVASRRPNAIDISKVAGLKKSQRKFPHLSAPLVIPGDELFKLYDTYGLPPDFVEDVVRNSGVTVDRFGLQPATPIGKWEVPWAVDREGYEAEMLRQRERARASWKGAEKKVALPAYLELVEKRRIIFDGYTQTTSPVCGIVALVQDGRQVGEVRAGTEVEIVLDRTPFYSEAGGQVGDSGRLFVSGSRLELADVRDTYSPTSGLVIHKASARQALRVGEYVTAVVDAERRDAIRRNHTGTHLLHAALRHTLGTHVKQAGSLVAPDRLRFDFTHYAPLDPQDLLDIEDLVNEHVLKNEDVNTEVMDLDSAINSGAMALFGEKYGDKVRVVSIADGSFSKELCGGTHVRRTGDIGLLKIASEGSVAAGTRRIEALTGTGVLEDLRRKHETLTRLGETLRAKPDELLQAVEKLEESEKKLRKQLEAQQMKRAAQAAGDLVDQAKEVKGVRVLVARVDAPAVDVRAGLRQMVDNLRARLTSGVIVLGSASDGKVALLAAVSKDLTNRLDAGKIVKAAAAIVEGSGGGRKDLAEAGGKNPEKLDESLRAIPGIVAEML